MEFTYTFTGWSPSIEDVTGDAVYTATYSAVKNKYKLSFDLNGGTLDGKTGIIVIEAEAGTEIIIPQAPTREGYIFKFWKGSEYYPGDKYLVEGDHTFIAEWEGVKTDEPKKEEPKKEVKKTKVTGDSTNIIILFTLLIISFLGIILIIRKKENS